MFETRGRVAALVAVAALALAGCGDDSEPAASETGSQTGSETPAPEPSTPPKDTGPDLSCPPDVAAIAPAWLGPESCWAVPEAENPVYVDGTLFALVPDPLDVDAPRSIVALDPETGAQLWTTGPLPGAVSRIGATELDGEPAIGAVVTEDDDGDALTEASQGWGYLAWTADVGGAAGDDSGEQMAAVEPGVHLTAPQSELASTEVYWTDQGILAGDQFLAPGADAFVTVNREPEPMIVGNYDLDESFAGVSGDLLLSYVRGVAWTDGGGENGDTYVGWLARTADGAEAWNTVTSRPNEEDSLFGEGPNQLAIVVGSYLLTITPTDENYTAFELTWLDAATHEAATPTPADIAGARPIAADSDVMAGDTGTLLSPDGRHLFASWSTLAVIVDIEAGTVTRIPTDFDIVASAIDDTTVYGSTENGALTVDLATAEATPIEQPNGTFFAVDGDFGVDMVGDGLSTPQYLVGGRITDAG